MEIVTGIFSTRDEAARAIEELRALGISDDKLGFMMPGDKPREVERAVPVSDTEEPGMGKAMGAAVGGAMGVAGGASLGAAAASLVVPAVGPVIAIGIVAATLLGIAGAATGAAAGSALEEGLGEGLPHEDLYLYEEALRRGHSVIIAFAEDGAQLSGARQIMKHHNALDQDELRQSWWRNLRGQEEAHYRQTGNDFKKDELSYRRGFEAALHAKRRSKSYAEAAPDLRKVYDERELDEAFRQGYERGLSYQLTVVEIHRV